MVVIATELKALSINDMRARYDLEAIRQAEPYPFYGQWKESYLEKS